VSSSQAVLPGSLQMPMRSSKPVPVTPTICELRGAGSRNSPTYRADQNVASAVTVASAVNQMAVATLDNIVSRFSTLYTTIAVGKRRERIGYIPTLHEEDHLSKALRFLSPPPFPSGTRVGSWCVVACLRLQLRGRYRRGRSGYILSQPHEISSAELAAVAAVV
jgi:hypothetical protein